MQEWYCTQNGTQQGPFSAVELKQRAASGVLQPTDLIWKTGMANWVPATSIKYLFAAPPAPAPVATTPGPQASPFPPCPTAVAAPPAAPPQGSTGWQARVQQAKTTWAGWTPGKKAAVAGTVAGALALFVLLPCCLTVSFLAGAFGSSPPPPGGSSKVGTSKPLFGGFPAHPGDNAANPPEADPTPADASSDYKDGYKTGLSLGRQKVDLYRGMSAGEKAKFHKVFNEMADQFDENYQQARDSAGPNNGGTQRLQGIADGYRKALQDGGVAP